MIVSRQIFYSGHVQGVGFRYTVKRIASGYDITGWVRNLADGRVELQASGELAELDRFLAAIAASELQYHIRDQEEVTCESAPNKAAGFEIRH